MKTTWQKIYNQWRRSEMGEHSWQPFFESKGFKSWEEWRGFYLKPLKCEELDWSIQPLNIEDVPLLKCGAFVGWSKIAQEVGGREFSKVATHHYFAEHEKVVGLKSDFPKEVQLIGFLKDGKITLLEGHHRAVALSQLIQEGRVPQTTLTIALGKIPKDQPWPLVDFIPEEYKI